ncbi:endonuclease/exonuclease/phosphatase family protein [Marininema halotolerans]|uniref:Metal-dependent hydrolase, endonuclease/exonuclease/phosphatase family n=1 Tax=Marininema halotolerans TaxID=1155944 RepID=A0A1I6SHF4_9BACL|nr:endonuclease/exonuclease/phosphatase family protein [Marininema halotolerans]SFS76339.1 Metal-dependent hydrolase, endonuclease/exonuclease/phosphatase family [Marininema halotolerans]
MSGKRMLTVMTQNMYLGASPLPLFGTTAAELPPRVTQVVEQFLATNIFARVNGIAAEVKRVRPDLLAFQAVEIVRLLAPPGSQAPSVTYNFLTLIQRALRKQGLDYQVVSIGRNFFGTAPSSTNYTVSLRDRTVILANRNSPLSFSNVQNRNFRVNLVTVVGGNPFPNTLGYSIVDVNAYGRKFKFATAHLDFYSPAIRLAQVNELIRALSNTNLPVLLIGDFNSDAITKERTYQRLLNAGYTDAWNVKGVGSGATYGNRDNLLNVFPMYTRRDDYVLFKGRSAFQVNQISRTGATQRSRRPSAPLWPSQNAGVAANLQLL